MVRVIYLYVMVIQIMSLDMHHTHTHRYIYIYIYIHLILTPPWHCAKPGTFSHVLMTSLPNHHNKPHGSLHSVHVNVSLHFVYVWYSVCMLLPQPYIYWSLMWVIYTSPSNIHVPNGFPQMTALVPIGFMNWTQSRHMSRECLLTMIWFLADWQFPVHKI